MNNYIFEYYQQIKDGTVSVGAWIARAYEYLVKGLENRSFFYSHKEESVKL